jgi:hypothetical protein
MGGLTEYLELFNCRGFRQELDVNPKNPILERGKEMPHAVAVLERT